jgi:ABC-type Zn uptake system ZnuABC Zn-binding protein ZnuA
MKAFPLKAVNKFDDSEGMDLRDYFAAQALSGGLEQGSRDNMDIHWWHDPERIADRAYAIADAMMRARDAS